MITRYQVQTPLGTISLASDETLRSIVPSVLTLPEEPEDPLDVLMRMASVTRVYELGIAGPVIASLANKENAANPEVRRYEAKFGRDAFYTAAFLSDLYPGLEVGTVWYFAGYQATRTDPRSLSAPGKIASHIRDPDDPLARRLTAESGRRWPWFGGPDTTVLFLLAACRVVDRDPDAFDGRVVRPADHPEAGTFPIRNGHPLTLGRVIRDATTWLLCELDRPDALNLLWVGLNRKDSFTIWTDSPNAFHNWDGQLARPPVAPVQLQAEVHDALLAVARLATHRRDLGLDPGGLLRRAERIRSCLLDKFVVDHALGPFLANGLAITSRGQPEALEVRTIGMGMALDSDALAGKDARQLRDSLVRHLFSDKMLSPFGVVGRARDEVRFEPFDYHSQVWGFAVHRVARGLTRHGYADMAHELNGRLLEQTRDGFLPENVGAGEDDELCYCPHILTVERPAPDGRSTITVKERTPAPYAAWTAGAVLASRRLRPCGGLPRP